MYCQDKEFKSVTIFILASNETESLNLTVQNLYRLKHFSDIDKIIIVTKNNTCAAYCAAEKIISENSDGKVQLYVQKSDCVEKCLAEIPLIAEGSHFVIMVADGEMEISRIDEFISLSKKSPGKIVCASKWHKESTVIGYGKLHEFFSRSLNLFVSLVIGKKATDLFTIYQIYPVSVYKRLNFSNDKSVVYEYTLKAIRNGVEYEEIPMVYKQRNEGKSNFNYTKLFCTAILFCLTALKIRFSPKEKADNPIAKIEVNK